MKILVFDSNSIVNRAFYGIKLLTTKDGQFTNAIYGFFNISLRLIQDLKPDRVVFTFDLRAPTFRHKMYDGYKAQRKGMPEELAAQMPYVKEIITSLGYPIVELAGYEADDILGTFAKCGEKDGNQILLATGDKDSLQLVSQEVTVILATTKAGGAQYIPMTPESIMEKYGVVPSQLIETKALMGDTSDNIPGVRGIGEKTAFALIKKYNTLAEIYEKIEEIEVTPGVRKKLIEGKEDAFLSRTLGEIYTEVPCGDYLEISQRKEIDNDALYSTLSKLELHTMIIKMGVTKPSTQVEEIGQDTPTSDRKTYRVAPLDLAKISTATKMYLSTTVENNIVTALVVNIGDNVLYHCENPDQDTVKAICTHPSEKWIDDCKPLHKAVMAMGGTLEHVQFDCRLAGYLLSPNSTEYTIERLSGEYDVTIPMIAQAEPLDCMNQCALLPELCEKMSQDIEKNDQHVLLHEIEIPLAQVLASMELIGFKIDLDALRDFGVEIGAIVKSLEQEIYVLADKEFNINSPKQVGVVLFEDLELPVRKKTKSGYSTDVDVLESLVTYHPIVTKILEHRKYSKLKSTYIEGLDKVTGEDSVIRTSFNQTETRTGRISSTEPNMQNIPIRTEPGSRMRGFFVAREGKLLIDADYSQIELRVLASIAKDENMIDAFLSGEDIHTNTAAQVFDLPPLFITPLMRSRAKAVNFGIVYGISAFSLSKDIGVTVPEADKYIKDYLKTYDGVKNYMDTVVADAKECGYVTTELGRRRYIPELKSSNFNLRGFGQRVAMNMPIQGTAADIIKIAMVKVYERLKEENLEAQLILQVHDELIVEAPAHEAEQVKQLVKEAMEDAIKMAVPMQVEIKIGKDWGEAH